MPFEKGHKKGAKKMIGRSLDKKPITFKGYEGTRDAIRQVPDWQEKLRVYVESLIAQHNQDVR